jgi:DNA-damage-inducible protein J
MSKTEFVRARIEPTLKRNVETILAKLGLNTTQAITLFFKQMELKQGLPFPVELPNEETRETFEKTDRGEDLIQCDDAEDMFKKLKL